MLASIAFLSILTLVRAEGKPPYHVRVGSSWELNVACDSEPVLESEIAVRVYHRSLRNRLAVWKPLARSQYFKTSSGYPDSFDVEQVRATRYFAVRFDSISRINVYADLYLLDARTGHFTQIATGLKNVDARPLRAGKVIEEAGSQYVEGKWGKHCMLRRISRIDLRHRRLIFGHWQRFEELD